MPDPDFIPAKSPDFISVSESPDFIPAKQGVVPQAVLDNLREKSANPTQFELDRPGSNRPGGGAFGQFLDVLKSMGPSSGTQNLDRSNIGLLSKSQQQQQIADRQDQIKAGIAQDQFRKQQGYGPVYRAAAPFVPGSPQREESALRGDTAGVIGGMAAPQAVVAATALAPKVVGAGKSALSKVTATPDPAVNFSAALNEGGKLPGAIRVTEDVAQPIVNKFRENWAKLGYTEADAVGPEAHTKMANAARATVADIETQGQRYKGVIGGMRLNGLQNDLASQIEGSRPVTTDPGINDAWGRIADKVRNAKTYNDLFELKADLNKLTGGKSFGNVSADASGAMDAAADAGDVLRKGINQGVKQITGTDIEPLMKQEQAAIRAQTLAEKAEPNLSRQQAANQTVGYGKRLRSGETSLETLKQAVGKGKPTGYELFQDRLKRAVTGASAGLPETQGPLGPFSGQYVRNSPYGPNPGEGPLSPAGSLGPVQSKKLFGPNPGGPGLSGLPETTPVTSTPTGGPTLRKLLGLR